jgi:iron donor protein CyaY
MPNNAFSAFASKVINDLADTIEEQDEECLIEVDLQQDILTLSTDRGIFVINKHSAAKEIWLSSPISGPHHFAYKEGKWQSRAGKELFTILSAELRKKLG